MTGESLSIDLKMLKKKEPTLWACALAEANGDESMVESHLALLPMQEPGDWKP